MSAPTYKWARLQELSGAQMHEILQARALVFVVEQNCVYPDADDCDYYAWHLTGHINGQLACYARVVDPGYKYPEPSIGRVLTTADFRGRQLGRQLMQEAIRLSGHKFPGRHIVISAQAHLHDFYQSLGFVRSGDVYLEDGIPHIQMQRLHPPDNSGDTRTR